MRRCYELLSMVKYCHKRVERNDKVNTGKWSAKRVVRGFLNGKENDGLHLARLFHFHEIVF